jgi:hypothetical protein
MYCLPSDGARTSTTDVKAIVMSWTMIYGVFLLTIFCVVASPKSQCTSATVLASTEDLHCFRCQKVMIIYVLPSCASDLPRSWQWCSLASERFSYLCREYVWYCQSKFLYSWEDLVSFCRYLYILWTEYVWWLSRIYFCLHSQFNVIHYVEP